ncbi:hypothetical protein GRF29_8g2368657 [Pseudopithomyces chartarum]|uniref:PD-(D/E)XK nuclease-like domain-containing protein n=1 Tax=Pseudopithomyces chartarum TaxID=1892770 RepID=A0AAN6M7S4_9PLEO|nr:hypothetical protein GRF29_8g2368657 [Pseudopithomyces chartarum]
MSVPSSEAYVEEWLSSFSSKLGTCRSIPAQPLTPSSLRSSPLIPAQSGKRKRSRSMPEPRPQCPQKRQRRLRSDNDIFPDQSASDIGITELSERTRLSRPSQYAGSSPKRTTSPVRDLLKDLRVLKPSIFCEIPSSVILPESAAALQQSLMDRLEEGLIPASLKSNVLAKYPSIAASIPIVAYDLSDTRSANELGIMWDSVEEILSESRDCGRYQQDKNAWCMKVVYSTLRLALKGNHSLKVESVQTQAINPEVLPITPKNYRVQKKADYAFSFHHNAPQISDLYDQLYLEGLGDRISHTTDANTNRLALFSGIDVKQENGGKNEALAQLAIWLAAGLESVRRLGELGQEQQYLVEELHPVVRWTVISHDWYTYIAYRVNQGGRDTFNVVGPWRVAAADTRDVKKYERIVSVCSAVT